MRCSDNILIDESIKIKQRKKLVAAIASGTKLMDFLYVTRVKNGNGLLEILPPKELYRLEKLNREFVILAVLKDEKNAMTYVESVVSDLVLKYSRVALEDLDKEIDIHWL